MALLPSLLTLILSSQEERRLPPPRLRGEGTICPLSEKRLRLRLRSRKTLNLDLNLNLFGEGWGEEVKLDGRSYVLSLADLALG
jgi:hypothetical protein